MPLKYHVFENIMENGAFAKKVQMLHFPFGANAPFSIIFSKTIQNLT